MEKNFKEVLAEAIRLQSAIVEKGILSTGTETSSSCIVLRCTCDNIEQCAVVMSMINKSDMFKVGTMGVYNTQTEKKSLWVQVDLD